MSHSALFGAQAPSSETDQQVLLLGKDIFFNGDFDVNAAGDFVLLEGLEAVRQSIYRRLMTRPGEFKLRPEYGVGVINFVKKRRIQSTVDQLRQRIVDQLSLDTRIAEVLDVVVEQITDGLKVGIVVRVAGETLKFRPFLFTEQTLIGGIGGKDTAGLRIS